MTLSSSTREHASNTITKIFLFEGSEHPAPGHPPDLKAQVVLHEAQTKRTNASPPKPCTATATETHFVDAVVAVFSIELPRGRSFYAGCVVHG